MEKLMSDQVLRQYEYKLSTSQGLFVLLIFGLFAYFGLSKALHNNRGLTINHIVELSASMATYFWWGSALLFSMLALLGLVMVIKSFQDLSLITLYDMQMTAPKKPISNTMLTVKYSDISKIKVHKIAKARQLHIDSPQGKIVIPDVNFANKADFDDLLNILMQKVPR